jgi:hypothetical protein
MTNSPRTCVDERRSARGCDHGRGSRLGRKNRAKAGKTYGTSDDDENDGAHDVKCPHGRAIATVWVGVGVGGGWIRGGDTCPYALCREWGGAEVEAWGEDHHYCVEVQMAKWVVCSEPARDTTHLIVIGPTRHESVRCLGRSLGP